MSSVGSNIEEFSSMALSLNLNQDRLKKKVNDLKNEFNESITRILDHAGENLTEGAYIDFSNMLKDLHQTNKKIFDIFSNNMDEQEIQLDHYKRNYQRVIDMYDQMKEEIEEIRESIVTKKKKRSGFFF